MKHRYPDFLCIGAQKAGTTWLHENLRDHPAIWLPPVKELQYFNDLYIPGHREWTGKHRRTHGVRAFYQHVDKVPRDMWDYRFLGRTADIIGEDISDDWYGRIFTLAAEHQVCGEMTPEYSLLPAEGIEHLLRLAPEVKIILSLRDPIERNWSHIRMIARSLPDETPADLRRIASFPDVMARADYATIIARWSNFVPSQRNLILFMDDIATRPNILMADVCKFLGVEFNEAFFKRLAKPTHVGEKLDIPPEIYELLKEQLRPFYAEISRLYPELGSKWTARHY